MKIIEEDLTLKAVFGVKCYRGEIFRGKKCDVRSMPSRSVNNSDIVYAAATDCQYDCNITKYRVKKQQ